MERPVYILVSLFGWNGSGKCLDGEKTRGVSVGSARGLLHNDHQFESPPLMATGGFIRPHGIGRVVEVHVKLARTQKVFGWWETRVEKV